MFNGSIYYVWYLHILFFNFVRYSTNDHARHDKYIISKKNNNVHLQISHVFLKVPDMIHNIIHNSIFRRHNFMIFSDTSWVIIAVVKLCAKISYNLWEIVANLAWKFENVHGHSKWSNKQYQYIPSITSNQDTRFFFVSLSVIYLDEN